MTDSNTPAPKQPVVIGWIGAILVRLIIPAWIIFGALQKVLGGSPKSLPRSILDGGGILGFQDYHLLLSILVCIEFLFVGIMLFIPKLSRLAAATMLSVFLVVLCVEMFVYGNFESCGCFGEKSMAPITMYAIDYALLAGVVIFKPRESKCHMNKGKRAPIAATLFTLLAWIFTFSTIMYSKNNSFNSDNPDMPSSWYPQHIGDWIGKSIDDVDLFSWVKEWPRDIHSGKQYVIFYSLTCDHCEALLYAFFEFPSIPTTLVAVPESTESFNYEGAFENPCFDCDKTELFIGTDWIIGTPLVVAIEDGIIKCAIENEDYEVPACLIW
ncbi:MAG: hypothetical protein QF718_01495 [Phycisphaerales bacterium]|jgi:hypothetical protein|nr:hypothetical protein [Phycisphaerales bacterium]